MATRDISNYPLAEVRSINSPNGTNEPFFTQNWRDQAFKDLNDTFSKLRGTDQQRTVMMLNRVAIELERYNKLRNNKQYPEQIPKISIDFGSVRNTNSGVAIRRSEAGITLLVNLNPEDSRPLIAHIGNELFNIEVFLGALNAALKKNRPFHQAMFLAANESTHPLVEATSYAINYTNEILQHATDEEKLVQFRDAYQYALSRYTERYHPKQFNSKTKDLDPTHTLLTGALERVNTRLSAFLLLYGENLPLDRITIENNISENELNGATVNFKSR